MMRNVSNIPCTMAIVDGAEVYVIDRERLDMALENESPALARLLKWQIGLVSKYPELSLAYYFVGPRRYPSWIVLLKMSDGALVRVLFETVTCGVCKWYGAIGNPMLSDLYMGMSDWWTILKRVGGLPRVGCPKCGSVLPRPALWTESLRPHVW